MQQNARRLLILFAVCFSQARVFGQIDPEERHLIQLGYSQAMEGHTPFNGYAFYYLNKPDFPRTNVTLRLAVAPVYLDGELGFKGALGENTDLGLGLAGGGFADSYYEIRNGKWQTGESFLGHGGEVSGSIYHLFNPGRLIPLNGLFRVSAHDTIYERDDQTNPKFVLPEDHGTLNVRTGLRFGGEEPVMQPALAMEMSGWYETRLRTDSGAYGFNHDRQLESMSHLFWGRALLYYTLTNSGQRFGASLTYGTSIDADRLSAYRLGGVLPLNSEFPLILPGYYFEEISARSFGLVTATYSLPLDPERRWNLTGVGSLASVDYVAGLHQPGHTHEGLGLSLGYRSPSGTWQVLAGYSYGFEAVRSDGRGAQSIGILCQIDLEARYRAHGPLYDPNGPARSRGLFRFLDRFF